MNLLIAEKTSEKGQCVLNMGVEEMKFSLGQTAEMVYLKGGVDRIKASVESVDGKTGKTLL